MSEPLVSIFCPSYNHENFVEEMLQSLISQTYKNIEIIIIDDCSNDKTPQIIQTFAEVYPDKIKFIKGVANLGVAERWNQMLKIIKGDYLACVGSDDILPINAIENRVNYLVEHPAADFLLTEFDIISDNGKIYYGKDKLEIAPQFKRFYEIESISELYEMLLVGNFIQIGAGLIRIKSYAMDEIILNKNLPNLHDYDQLLKLIYGHKVAFIDKSTYLYRYHKNSTSSQDNPKKNPREVGVEMEVILLEQLKKQQSVKERIRTLETILNGRTEPDNSWKLNVVIEAEEYILNNQFKEAEELLLYLITRDSTNIDAFINLGVIAANENKFETSRHYFLNVLALDSQNELAIENLAFVEEALNLDKSGTLKFTGERFIPEENGQIAYEHFNRYLMANEYVAGKDVLDIASGEGYGSALLANLAKSVIGVDISEEAVSHASNKYGDKDNLEFKVGDCVNIPCNDNQFDIVVSFETIEHIMEQEKFLSEIKRVLKKDGKLIISSPNKSIYSNDEYQNEFHLKELTFEEFQKLLSEHFENTTLFGQRITFSSHIWPINVKDGHILFKNYTIKENEFQNIPPYEPEYFIAICSNVQLKISESASLFTADDDILFKEYHNRGKWGIDLDKELNETKKELNQVKQQYSELVKEHHIILNSLKEYSLSNKSFDFGLPQLEITKLDSFVAYQEYEYKTRNDYQDRNNYEKSLLTSEEKFEVKGICYSCKKEVNFLVDYWNCYYENELKIPNWRERLVCPDCELNNRMRLSIHLIEDINKNLSNSKVYIAEQTTQTYRKLKTICKELVGSEYIGNSFPFGTKNSDGIRNEDFTNLTFGKEEFDLVLSFDVFEHIYDYKKAFAEAFRVMKKGGSLLFTVPFDRNSEQNITRAKLKNDGSIEHLLAPEYHGDPMNTSEGCLCYFHFGWEMLNDLKEVGFDEAYSLFCYSKEYAYLGGDQVFFVARKN